MLAAALAAQHGDALLGLARRTAQDAKEQEEGKTLTFH
jgi:hypothetical protein